MLYEFTFSALLLVLSPLLCKSKKFSKLEFQLKCNPKPSCQRAAGDFCRKGPNFQGLKLLGGFDSLDLRPHIYLFPFHKALVSAKKRDILLFSCSQFSSQKVQYHSYLLKDELGIYLLSNIKNFFLQIL